MKQLLKKAKYLSIFLLAISYLGCEDVENLFPDVTSAFTYTVNEETGTVTFINISEDAKTYLWNFGDSTTSTEINPVKSYAAAGTYTVTLKASNEAGASDTSEDQVTVTFDSGGGETCTAETAQSLDATDFNLTFQTDPGSAIIADGAAYSYIDNPDPNGINTSCKVGEIVRDASLPFANNQIVFDSKFDFTANAGFKLKVWAPAVGTNVLLKLEDKADAGINTEVAAVTTTANAWEELTFDFPATESGKFDKIVLFFDINTDSGATYYIDDFALYTEGGGGTCTAETAQSLDATDFNLTFQSDPGSAIIADGAAYSYIDNPDPNGINTSCKVGEIVRDASLPFANNQIVFDAKFDFTANAGFKLKVWAPAVGTNVLLKLEDKTDSGINTEVGAVTTTGNAWEELTFDFPATESGKYDKIVLFFDITTDSGATYYIDDFALYTDGGGGTPPTAATALPVTFESNETLTGVFEEGDGVTGAPIANPDATGINTSATVYEFTKATGAAWYSGMFNVFASDFDAAAGTTFKVKIWSPKANINVRFQLEKEGNQGPIVTYNVDQTLATADTWVEMTFDFSGTALNLADGYDKIIIFPEFDEAGQPAGDGSIYYIDDIIQEAGSGGGPIAPTAGPTAPTQDAADVISIFSDSYTNVPNAGFNNYGSAAFEQVDLGGNAALKYTFVDVGGGNFQVIELGGDQIDAAAAGMTNFRFDLWFPNEVDASSTFLMKLVDIPGSGATEGSINIGAASTPAMAQGSWLSFDIPITELEANGLGGSSNIQQVVIDLMNSGEVYIDNLYFYKPGAGGGNLAANGDFETGDDTGWLLFQNGGTAALDNSINNGGSWSGRLATGGPSNPAFKQERIGAGTVSAGDVVQVQFDHIGSVVQPGAVFNVLLFGEGAAGASFTHVFNPAPTLSGSWTTFTATYTIPGGTDVSEGISFLIEAVCGGDPGCSVTANIDNVSVTLNP